MSNRLAAIRANFDLVTPADCPDSPRRPAWLAGTATLPQLEDLPWLSSSGAAMATQPAADAATGPERMARLLPAGLAAAIALLAGGALYLTGDPAPAPAAIVQQAGEPLRTPATLPATQPRGETGDAAIVERTADDAGSATIGAPAATPPARLAGKAGPVAGRPLAARQLPVASSEAPAPAAPQMADTNAEASVATAAQPAADSTASPATLKAFRSAIDECRDRIRAVTRLGNRNRPGRDATAAEESGYRLRQQNAEAARAYRGYVEMLNRSVRRANSESHTRQSLERARETLAYLDGMLAASEASLR